MTIKNNELIGNYYLIQNVMHKAVTLSQNRNKVKTVLTITK